MSDDASSIPLHLSPLAQLRRQMATRLSLGELQLLCFDPGVNFDELTGAALSPKITSLLRVVKRDGRWPDLITALSHTYPNTEWPAATSLQATAVTETEFGDEPDQPGVMAQGPGATAVGAGSVYVGGNVGGSIHTGDVHHHHTAPELTFPIANLPPARPHFTGRAAQLQRLRDAAQGRATTITQTIAGPGGVGKSRLMLEFAHRQRDAYDIIWWLRVDGALAIREKALGADHPATATSLNNVGALLRAMGDLAGARPYYERALAILAARLRPDHPHTQTVRRNLAALPDE